LCGDGDFLHGGWVVQRRKEGLGELGFRLKKGSLNVIWAEVLWLSSLKNEWG
jgi:hypothetical protein